MFKKLLSLILLFVIDGQLQAKWGRQSNVCPELSIPKFNPDQAFSDLHNLIKASNNSNAQEAAEDFIKAKESFKKTINEASPEKIKDDVRDMQQGLVSLEERSKLSVVDYKKLLNERYKTQFDGQLKAIKNCNSKENCQKPVFSLLALLLYEGPIKQ